MFTRFYFNIIELLGFLNSILLLRHLGFLYFFLDVGLWLLYSSEYQSWWHLLSKDISSDSLVPPSMRRADVPVKHGTASYWKTSFVSSPTKIVISYMGKTIWLK